MVIWLKYFYDSLNIVVILDPIMNASLLNVPSFFNICGMKLNTGLFCFGAVIFYFEIILINDANFKSHWNILVFYDQLKMMSDLNMSHGKMSDFV